MQYIYTKKNGATLNISANTFLHCISVNFLRLEFFILLRILLFAVDLQVSLV